MFIMLPWAELVTLMKSLVWLARDDSRERAETVVEFYHFAGQQQQETLVLSKAAQDASNPFLREALELLSLGLRSEDISKIFDQKIQSKENLNSAQAGFLLTMSKLGPGLGLVGTLVGMVSLLYSMGQGVGLEQIGPAMGIALCATLYGVATSNLVFIPLAEALVHKSEKQQLHMQLITEGAIMLREKRHPVHIREALKAYLIPKEQQLLDAMTGTKTGPGQEKGAKVA